MSWRSPLAPCELADQRIADSLDELLPDRLIVNRLPHQAHLGADRGCRLGQILGDRYILGQLSADPAATGADGRRPRAEAAHELLLLRVALGKSGFLLGEEFVQSNGLHALFLATSGREHHGSHQPAITQFHINGSRIQLTIVP